ncbi:MAG: response regulator [Spirochaetales bacterium]|nr:response regulator [Spirochaetales bacterium]
MNRQDVLEKKAKKPFGIRSNGVPLKVVVVDDVFIDRRIMTQVLRSAGFDVCAECSNGEEALIHLQNEKPDLVILDYLMPGMNGFVTLQEIRKRYGDLPVIMQTSETEKELALKLIREGASDYIVKPFDRAVVMAKLRRIVRGMGLDAPGE